MIGKLRHRLALQRNSPTRNTLGENTDSWSTLTTIYGRIEPLSTLERLAAGKDTPVATHRAITRHRPISHDDWTFADGGEVTYADGTVASFTEIGIGEAQRILYDERYFDVVSVIDEDERHRWDRWVLKEVG